MKNKNHISIKGAMLAAMLTFCIGIGSTFARSESSPPPKKEFSLKITKKFDVAIPHTPNAVAWSPDGSALAVSSNFGGNLTIIDNAGNKLLRLYHEVDGPCPQNTLVAFVNGASQVLFPPTPKSDDSILFVVRDAKNDGKIIKEVKGAIPGKEIGRNSPIAFAVSADQKLAASTNSAFVITYDTTDWHQLQKLKLHGQALNSLAFSPDGKQLAIGTLEGKVVIIDPISGGQIKDIQVYETKYGAEYIQSISISPDGKYLLVADGGGALFGTAAFKNGSIKPEALTWQDSIIPILVLRASDGKQVASFKKTSTLIRQAVWDPKGRFVALIDQKSRLFLWELATNVYKEIDLPPYAYSVAITQDGKLLAATNGHGASVFTID